jgi:hypothetical protein
MTAFPWRGELSEKRYSLTKLCDYVKAVRARVRRAPHVPELQSSSFG